MDAWSLIRDITSMASCLAGVIAVFVAVYVHYDSKRPVVVSYLEHDRDHGCIYLVISNQGNGVAYDVKVVSFDFSLVGNSYQQMSRKSFLSKGIPVLVPGGSRSTVIQAGPDMKEFADRSGVIQLSFGEKGVLKQRHECRSEFVLDYYSFSGSIFIQSDLHEIRIASQHIDKSLKTLSDRISSLSAVCR